MDDLNVEKSIPKINIAMKYNEKDEIFSFCIKKVTNVPSLMSISTRYSRVVFHVVHELISKTWTGRLKAITCSEIFNKTAFLYRTLIAPRHSITTFNEFFSFEIKKTLFHTILLKFQLCDVSKDKNEVLIAQCEYCIDSNSINQFRELELPMDFISPDLGELEFSLTYLPTSQRVIVTNFKTTNFKVDQRGTDIYVRTTLFVNEDFDEIHKTEHKKSLSESIGCMIFGKKLVFDLMRIDLTVATMIFSVIEKIGKRKRVIGQCGVSYTSISRQWRGMIATLRQPISEIHKLHPGV